MIAVKNPSKSSPSYAGLPIQQKANFSQALIEKLDDYIFVPLIPVDFLYYQGAELLSLARKAKDTEAHIISECLEKIPTKEILAQLGRIVDAQSIAPIIDKQWV